jgi:hypothetical protein
MWRWIGEGEWEEIAVIHWLLGRFGEGELGGPLPSHAPLIKVLR